MGKLIDADKLKDFSFSETSGTEETIKKCKCCDKIVCVVTFLYNTKQKNCGMVMVEYNSC